ncbi:geranylgeranyl diphosphate synthase, type II [Lachnospiraceae bacterium NE2001]|nr:geranylgeranyl diphosphate synthase, type II [Lachnospiraceae bacterium NE2001]
MTKELENVISIVNNRVMNLLPNSEGYPSKLVEAMNYAVSAGGKRIRPTLLYLTYMMLSGSATKNPSIENNVDIPSDMESFQEYISVPIEKSGIETYDVFMTALEMIHTHSLIHDDLPALDNDSLRRGKPTVHVAFDEATAILAGDALLNYAYEMVSKLIAVETQRVKNKSDSINYINCLVRAQSELALETGIDGMLGGQALDVELSGMPTTTEDRDYIYDHKTCALIKAPFIIGALLAGRDDQILDDLSQVGYLIGMAFQVQDDILDVTGDAAKLGKEVHQDARNEKSTYVSELGLEKSRQYVKDCSEKAISIIEEIADESAARTLMVELITELINRDN